jgi:hypothetical protein
MTSSETGGSRRSGPEPRQRFPSKVDGWFVGVLAASALLVVLLLFAAVSQRNWHTAAVLLVVLAVSDGLGVWLLRGTFYVVTPDRLLVRSGPFRWDVPLGAILSIAATRNPASSPALSMDRLEIRHAGGTILVSPRDRAGFVDAVRAGAPAADVRGSF